ncbi:Platinum sensitivity protein [Mortierella sp. 14UC]|nr:Platinum sensitivity protein [Mortierella sp. 14UC]
MQYQGLRPVMPVHSTQQGLASALTEKPKEYIPVALANKLTKSENIPQQADDSTNSDYSTYSKASRHLALATDDGDSDDPDESTLPTPGITNLNDIKEILLVAKADKQVQREMSLYIVDEEYIEKFILVLETFDIGDASVMDQIVKEGTFECCLGILESKYGPEKQPQYRRTFSRQNKFKQVIPIEEPYTLGLIHQLFRLQFLKDQVLSQVPGHATDSNPDDETGSNPDGATGSGSGDTTGLMLAWMIRNKSLEIVQDITYDQKFMDDLFEVLTNEAEPMHRRQDVVFFVYQLCTMAKKTSVGIYRKLDPFDFMRLLEFTAGTSNARVKQAGIEILQMALDTDPNFIRTHIAKRPSINSFKGFFDSIINQSLAEADVGVMPHFTVAIRTLLDIKGELRDEDDESLPSDRATTAKSSPDQRSKDEKFLDVFYEQFFSSLVAPVMQLRKGMYLFPETTKAMLPARRLSKLRLLDVKAPAHCCRRLLGFTPERLKIRLTSSLLAEKICLLFKNDAKHMRFENIKQLVSHCTTTHKETIKAFNYTPVFKGLMGLHAGCNNSEAVDLDFQAMVAARIRDIPRSHRRPFFKVTNPDTTMDTDGDGIAKRKKQDEGTTRMRTRQKRVMEKDTSNNHPKSSGSVQQ